MAGHAGYASMVSLIAHNTGSTRAKALPLDSTMVRIIIVKCALPNFWRIFCNVARAVVSLSRGRRSFGMMRISSASHSRASALASCPGARAASGARTHWQARAGDGDARHEPHIADLRAKEKPAGVNRRALNL